MSEGIKSVEQETSDVIRIAEPRDARAIFGVIQRSTLDAYPRFIEEVTPEMIAERFTGESGAMKNGASRYRHAIEDIDNGQHCFVVEDDQVITGFIAVDDGTTGSKGRFIEALYVDPESQGHGIGKKLLVTGLQELDATNNLVKLRVIKTNTPAIKLYEDFGFSIDREVSAEEIEYDPFPNGYQYQELEMIRKPAPIKEVV